MAKIVTESVVITFSKIVKDSESDTSGIAGPDIQQASIQSIIMHQRQHRCNRRLRRCCICCCSIFCLLLVFATIVYFLSTIRHDK